MRQAQSYFSIVLVAITVVLTLLAAIVVFTTHVFGEVFGKNAVIW